MRIAQIAPLYEAVPPKLYGGTERVVSYLTEELVRQGHDVTLFASGDSKTTARLRAPVPEALRLLPKVEDQIAPHVYMLEMLAREADSFDIIHSHVEHLCFPFFRRMGWNTVSTLHGNLNWPEVRSSFLEFSELPLVSISKNQQEPIPYLNWRGVVHHGLPKDLLKFSPKSQDYLAFVGRISPEKRIDRAVEIAIKSGIPVKIAAKLGIQDKEYYESVIKPLFDHPLVEFVGEINEKEKQEFIGNARAFLFPIDWCEPFGLVMIEAMATGTPVIAWNCGSVPEVVEDGVSGWVVRTIDEAVQAVEGCGALDRRTVRATFERRFTAERMAKDYVRIYERLTDEDELLYLRKAPKASGVPV